MLHVKNRLAELQRMDQLVRNFAARHALPEQATFELALALDEILTNVISYAYDDAGEHDILVHVSLDGCDLRVQIEDDGRPFDPLSVPTPDTSLPVDQRPVGGLGVHLARRVTDRLVYRRESGKNIVLMTKRVDR